MIKFLRIIFLDRKNSKTKQKLKMKYNNKSIKNIIS